ncbi:hypothetical protein H8356DRAFT_1363504 [Neocallimastix lanati (nom. inval.)]|nr:hypothetical protein H8356DRAFT_1363504 [Neocallimastix sp. JGI-2020a]
MNKYVNIRNSTNTFDIYSTFIYDDTENVILMIVQKKQVVLEINVLQLFIGKMVINQLFSLFEVFCKGKPCYKSDNKCNDNEDCLSGCCDEDMIFVAMERIYYLRVLVMNHLFIEEITKTFDVKKYQLEIYYALPNEVRCKLKLKTNSNKIEDPIPIQEKTKLKKKKITTAVFEKKRILLVFDEVKPLLDKCIENIEIIAEEKRRKIQMRCTNNFIYEFQGIENNNNIDSTLNNHSTNVQNNNIILLEKEEDITLTVLSSIKGKKISFDDENVDILKEIRENEMHNYLSVEELGINIDNENNKNKRF